MTGFTDLSFWLHFLLFIGAVGIAFYIPGDVVLRSMKFPPLTRVVLSFVIGVVLWGLQGMIFGNFNVRYLSYVYLAVMIAYWIYTRRYRFIQSLKKPKKWDFLALAMVVVGTAIQILPLWFSGYMNSNGLNFCCFWPDNLYHIAVTNQLVQSVPPSEAGMGDVVMKNYHYLGNLVTADIIRVFRLPLIATHNQFIPVFIGLLLGFSGWVFTQKLNIGRTFNRWFLFFLLFSGNIIFLALLLMGKGLFFSLNVTESATTLWFSPPRVFAMVALFAGLTLFLDWIKNKSLYVGVLMALLIGSLISFKVYIGIFALVGFGVVGIYYLLKKDLKMIFPLLLLLGLSLALYLPANKDAGGLVFTGLWRIEDFAVRPAFGLIGLELARQVYIQHNNILRIIQVELLFAGLFIFSWLGMFMVGILQTKKSLRMFPTLLHVVLLSGFVVTSVIGLLFIQQTGGSNTVQFLFNVYIVGSLYSALACWYWIPKLPKSIKYIAVILILFFVAVRTGNDTFSNIRQLIRHENYLVVNNNQLQASQYLSDHMTSSTKLAVDPSIALEDNCYYISFLTSRSQFLCGAGILEDHGVDVTHRVEELNTIFTVKDPGKIKEIIKEHNISYVYVVPSEQNEYFETMNYFKPVFRSDDVILYEIIEM